MRIPSSLTSLVEEGVIEEVVRPLMSGKEAEVFLVLAGGELRVAKIYKEAQNRSFKNRAEYTEGRKVRNSRDARAIEKRSRHGRAQDEAAWRSTEVDMIYRLREAGVRVPVPHHFIDGVLVMEMVADADGGPAPRLAEVSLDRDQAVRVFEHLLAEVVRMLCAGVVHGDLSDFNVLMSAGGPVIIDFPQSVDAASNQNARKLLLRDVENLKRFLSRFAPDRRPGAYAEEMWDLYANSLLTPEARLSGRHRPSERKANTAAVLDLIGDANYDERKRRERQGRDTRGVPAGQAPVRPANGAGPRPQHAGPRDPQPSTQQRPQQPQGRPPQAQQGQRPQPQQGPQQNQRPPHDQRPQQNQRPPHDQRAPQQRQPQGQRPQQDQRPQQQRPQQTPRPPQQRQPQGQRPPTGSPHPPEAQRRTSPQPPEEPQATPPRRVVITVDATQRHRGSRRTS
jgi:RIO kinase 1